MTEGVQETLAAVSSETAAVPPSAVPEAAPPPAAASETPPAAASETPSAAASETPSAAASETQSAADSAWLADILKKTQWESKGQHAARVAFMRTAVASMTASGELNEDTCRLLSGLFYSVKYLGCTYTPELEALLYNTSKEAAEAAVLVHDHSSSSIRALPEGFEGRNAVGVAGEKGAVPLGAPGGPPPPTPAYICGRVSEASSGASEVSTAPSPLFREDVEWGERLVSH
ncbi:hypothetical protein cyc_06295 [Cyclospora cayetanensis]|uniref:Uncharacterized protein n=1 Tax=Cyclospora cayetanensis TaxID=88456 RepID=A0A1D3D0U9_9EIME|nr:hypothetical protein cyc_06295 [Cyclospora cayetanensis]